MKITICGSTAFYDEMQKTKKELEESDHKIEIPAPLVENENGKLIPIKEFYKIKKTSHNSDYWVWNKKAERIKSYFDKVAWSDAILVLNYKKNNIKGYIGGNTLLEMGLAFYLGKKIYLLNPVPEISYKEEILGMKPIILEGDLTIIQRYSK